MPDQRFIPDLRFIRWAIGHIDEAERIYEHVKFALAMEDKREKVLAFHPVLDEVAEIIADIPEFYGSALCSEANEPAMAAEVKQEALAAGINWERLLDIAKKLWPFIAMFLGPQNDET